MDIDFSKQPLNPEYNSNKIKTLDDFFSYTQDSGSIAQAGSNILYGLNQTKSISKVPVNKDTQGFVFFTRPMLNLSKWNLVRSRKLFSLLTEEENSVHRYVRNTLDPSLENYGKPAVKCPMVDNKLVFIPLMSNTLLKLSGWPDVVLPTFTSKQGVRKEQWAIADGTNETNEVFDLDATFRNMADEPLSVLISTWLDYQSYVFDGQLKPYSGSETRNEIDYTTRIYRIVMDSSERFVKKIACTIASFPINDPTGKSFDYDRAQQYMDTNKEINIRFKSMGCVYNDPIIIKWFNLAGGYANPALIKVVASGFAESNTHSYTKIPHQIISLFKNRGYPLINPNTFELEWWIDKKSKTFKDIVGSYDITSTNLPL